MPPSTTTDRTNWQISYDDVPRIRIRDPVAEALQVLPAGDPFVITYPDLVTAAGHSCPTAAGAFRIAQLGLAAIYPDELPVRSDVAVHAGGPAEDPTYGVTARLISYVTGAAGVDGFPGIADGFGGRRNLLTYGEGDDVGVTFGLERVDTGHAVTVTYHVEELPDLGPAAETLPAIIDGSASPAEVAAFAEAWHGRVQRVLTDDRLFDVDRPAD